jgi:hypothetical protein
LIALNGNITGIFCDITYSKEKNIYLSQLCQELKEYQRTLPEWADFFSPDFIFISPPKDFNNILKQRQNPKTLGALWHLSVKIKLKNL